MKIEKLQDETQYAGCEISDEEGSEMIREINEFQTITFEIYQKFKAITTVYSEGQAIWTAIAAILADQVRDELKEHKYDISDHFFMCMLDDFLKKPMNKNWLVAPKKPTKK